MELKLSNASVLKILFIWCFFCSFIIALFYHFTETTINFLFVKDLVILVILILAFRLRRGLSLFSFFSLVFFSYLCLSFFLSNATFLAKAASIRQMVIPFVLIYVGYFLGKGINQYLIERFVLKIGLVVLFLGFFEIGLSIWHYVDITKYFSVKNIPVYNISYHTLYYYPVFFIEPILGGLKRMTSTILDPINLGHIFSFLLTIIIFDKKLVNDSRRKYWLASLFSLGLLLTFSKGAILQFIITILFISPKVSRGIKALIIIIFSILLICVSEYHAGILKHLEGLESALKNINLFGHGLAKTGNQAYMFGEPTVKIGDTFFGAIVGQIGIIGYILWFLPFYVIIKKLKINLISKILIAQILISLISENAFNLLSIFLVCVFLGIQYKQKCSLSNA